MHWFYWYARVDIWLHSLSCADMPYTLMVMYTLLHHNTSYSIMKLIKLNLRQSRPQLSRVKSPLATNVGRFPEVHLRLPVHRLHVPMGILDPLLVALQLVLLARVLGPSPAAQVGPILNMSFSLGLRGGRAS